MNITRFISELKKIKSVTSITGKRYISIKIYDNRIEFTREFKDQPESILLSELINLYSKENKLTTTIAKDYISGRTQSPAVAILNQLKKNILPTSMDVATASATDKISPQKKEQKINSKTKDEIRFFIALSQVVGIDNILSKSVGKPINDSHVFLSKNYLDFEFNNKINNCYKKILIDLRSNNLFSSESISHFIDGIIINHPILKKRIVEFDEEQHFTPARLDTLRSLVNILPDNYLTTFIEICENKEYLNKNVLKKHRIKSRLETIPKSFIKFTEWLEQSNEKVSGYICEKSGFPFLGGRIAQRAYYDCLRDTAHLSDKNRGFHIPLRFAKKTFEDIEIKDFNLIPIKRIEEIIIEILNKNYGISLLAI